MVLNNSHVYLCHKTIHLVTIIITFLYNRLLLFLVAQLLHKHVTTSLRLNKLKIEEVNYIFLVFYCELLKYD